MSDDHLTAPDSTDSAKLADGTLTVDGWTYIRRTPADVWTYHPVPGEHHYEVANAQRLLDLIESQAARITEAEALIRNIFTAYNTSDPAGFHIHMCELDRAARLAAARPEGDTK